MFLNRIHLNPRCREARRDLADPYQLHSTLCRAFSTAERRCPEGEFLWRLEPSDDPFEFPRILIQSKTIPDWIGIGVKGWLAKADPAIDLKDRLKLDSIKEGQSFRFRLRANPCVTRNGKRLGLFRLYEQGNWIKRKAELHGFSLTKSIAFDFSENSQGNIDMRITHGQMLRGNQRSGNAIRIYSVLYEGILTVTLPDRFRNTLETGIGHGKVMGLGLLSIVPIKL